MSKELVLILDFGCQYTQLIARRIRENRVFCHIVPYNIRLKEIEELNPKGLILSDACVSIFDKKRLLPDTNIFKLNIPILGISYGMGVIVHLLNGKLSSGPLQESGRQELFIDDNRSLFWQIPGNITCWMNTGNYIRKLPKGFKKIAHTHSCPFAAISQPSKKIFGLQFHPEVIHTEKGSQILSNFLYSICSCHGAWNMQAFIRETVKSVKKALKPSNRIICVLNDNVDSLTNALLLNKSIGRRLKCIFIDNGLMRLNEVKQIKKILTQDLNLHLKYLDANLKFLNALKGITDPEEKKKAVKRVFVKILEEEIKKTKGVKYLAQPTLYSDVIAANSKNYPALKGASSRPKLKIIEPLKDLFQDEVKLIAKELNLPESLIFRQSLPEAGLAARIIGEVTPLRLRLLREADACVLDEIKQAGLYQQLWQSFAVLVSQKCENLVAIRAVASCDGITADWVRLPYDILERISQRIIRIKGINRIVYDISPKPPVSIEWE